MEPAQPDSLGHFLDLPLKTECAEHWFCNVLVVLITKLSIAHTDTIFCHGLKNTLNNNFLKNQTKIYIELKDDDRLQWD